MQHADTAHELGTYGIVVFGVIDGYTHEIQCLSCDDNKKAKTLLLSLHSSKGVCDNGYGANLRIDDGMENVAIARLMKTINGHSWL